MNQAAAEFQQRTGHPLAWDADRIRHGLQGLWDAPNFYPYSKTLTYSEHLLGIAAFTAPVQWLSGNPVLAYNLAFLASYVLSGCGMYLLAVSVTGNRCAAAVAGVAFAVLPYRVSQVSHLQVLMCGWMPIALWALHRYFSVRSRLALAGFAAAFLLQVLSSLYYLYFLTLPVAVVVGAELVRARRRRVHTAVEIGLAALIILIVLAPIGANYYSVHSERGLVRTRGEIVHYSADVASYLHADPELRVWGGVLPRGRLGASLFPGAVLAGLAAVGLAAGFTRRGPLAGGITPATRRYVRVYLAITLLALLFSLGPEPMAWGRLLWSGGPYEWLLAFLPGFDGVRVPARLAMVVYLGLGVLAAVGAAATLGRLPRRITVVASVLLCGVVALEGYAAPLRVIRFAPDQNTDRYLAYEWLRRSPPGAVLELPLEGESHNSLYQFATLQHGHRVVNGHSGYTTGLLGHLRGAGSPLSEYERYPDFLRALRALGIRYIVTHAAMFERRGDAVATIEAIRQVSDQIIAATDFGDTSSPW